MPSSNATAVLLVMAVVGGALALAPSACKRGGGAAAHRKVVRGEPDAVYTVRGRVRMVPDPSKPQNEFQVHHEALPEFEGPGGRMGMDVMVMPFPVGEGVSLEGIAVGDVVEVEFGYWGTPGERGYEARRVTELPAETPLSVDDRPAGP